MSFVPHRFASRLTLIGVALTLAGCSKDRDARPDTTAVTPAPAATAESGAAPAGASQSPVEPAQFSDANIVFKSAAGDSAEVEIATLAEGKATSAAVKSYAATLVSDHGKGLKEVHALATKSAITPDMPAGDTTVLATSHVMERLQGIAKGAAFDTAFVNHEVEDYQQDIKDAKAMAGAAKNAQVKGMLEKELPELQKHLDIAQQLAKQGAK